MKTLQASPIKLSSWLSNYDKLIKVGFSEQEIENALVKSSLTLRDLTTTKGFKSEPKYMGTYEVVRDKYRFTVEEWMGEYKKDVEVIGLEVRIKCQYQHLRTKKLVDELFKAKFNWFNDNELMQVRTITTKKSISDLPISEIPDEYKNCTLSELRLKFIENKEEVLKSKFEIYGDSEEMYLKTEFGSLYIPYEALLKNDFSIIENRMKTYFEWYYNKADKKEQLEKALKPLESKEAKFIKSKLN